MVAGPTHPTALPLFGVGRPVFSFLGKPVRPLCPARAPQENVDEEGEEGVEGVEADVPADDGLLTDLVAKAQQAAKSVPTLKKSGCRPGRGKMQKKYKTKVLSLWTWPTRGLGFRLAIDAWRAFTAGLEPLEQEDVPAHDDRVTQLVAAAQLAAKQVRLTLN